MSDGFWSSMPHDSRFPSFKWFESLKCHITGPALELAVTKKAGKTKKQKKVCVCVGGAACEFEPQTGCRDH